MKSPYVGEGYKVQVSPNHSLLLTDSSDIVLIPEVILNIQSNGRFILIEQNPLDSICECNHECFKMMESYDKKSYDRCKKAIKESSFRQFWVVDKERELIFDSKKRTYSNIFGPYSKEDYLKKRDELGVPVNLNLVIEDKLSD